MFFYETSTVSVRTDQGQSNFDPLRCNAVKSYMGHYQNYLALAFLANYGTIHEKHQASKELEICARKMRYWERQPHFNHDEVLRQKARMNKTSGS